MASNYFDEHNCEPTPDGGPEVHTLLHWARLLLSDVRQFYLQNEGFGFPDELRKAPPASKEFVESLPEVTDSLDKKCPICLNEYEPGVTVKKLPCDHHFHCSCIVPWLQQTNSCPMCRKEYPTDDPVYEEFRKEKAREKQRQFERESLHNSMFT